MALRYLLIFILFLLLPSPGYSAESSDSAKSIEGLLNEAEGALLGKKEADAKPIQNKKKKAPITELAPEKKIEPRPESLAQLSPIDSTAIQKVIAVDLLASQREREPMYPITTVSLGLGQSNLNPTYTLTKDDDIFSNTSGGSLKGVYISFSPVWKVGFLETGFLRTFFSAVFVTGYSQGDVVMKRSGIQTGEQRYGIKLFPVDAGLQLSFELWKYFTLFGGYGPGLEVLHQDGLGINDSITDIFYGDEVWAGLSGRITDSISLFLHYKRKGMNLLFHSNTFGGQILSAGVAFNLSG